MTISTVDRTESYARSLRAGFIKNLAFERESATTVCQRLNPLAHSFFIQNDIITRSRQFLK